MWVARIERKPLAETWAQVMSLCFSINAYCSVVMGHVVIEEPSPDIQLPVHV